MKLPMVFVTALCAPLVMADFPLDSSQTVQVLELFDGLQGRFQQGTEARMSRVAWTYSAFPAAPTPLTIKQAQQLATDCVSKDQSHFTSESVILSIACKGAPWRIKFAFSDGQIVTGEYSPPPPPLVMAPGGEN